MTLHTALHTIAANQTDLADAVMDLLEAAMITQGWTFVEELAYSRNSANWVTRIMKSDAARTSHGADWYLYLTRHATNGVSVSIAASEGWDTVNKKMIAPVSSQANVTNNPTYWTTTLLGTGVALTDATTGAYFHAPSTALALGNSYDMMLAVDNSYVSLGIYLTGSSSFSWVSYFGMADPEYHPAYNKATFAPLVALLPTSNNGYRSRSVGGITTGSGGIFSTAPYLEAAPRGTLRPSGPVADGQLLKLRTTRIIMGSDSWSQNLGALGSGLAYSRVIGPLFGKAIAESSSATSRPRVGDTVTLDGVVHYKVLDQLVFGGSGAAGLWVPAGSSW